jgi:hypothetical protein
MARAVPAKDQFERREHTVPIVVNMGIPLLWVGGALDYLGNRDHRNHRDYVVQPVRVYGPPTVDAFIKQLEFALGFLNRELSASNRIKIGAMWWVGGFAPGSNLSVQEQASYEVMLIGTLGCSSNYAASWHLNEVTGAADFNLVDTGIETDSLPTMRRSKGTNWLARARARSDEWTQAANMRRTAAGIPAIPSPFTFHETRRRNDKALTIEELLERLNPRPQLNSQNLSASLSAIGLKPSEWDVSIDGRLLLLDRIPGRLTKKKVLRSIRVHLGNLFESVNCRLRMKQVMSEEREIDLQNGDELILQSRTTTDVIQEPSLGPTMAM